MGRVGEFFFSLMLLVFFGCLIWSLKNEIRLIFTGVTTEGVLEGKWRGDRTLRGGSVRRGEGGHYVRFRFPVEGKDYENESSVFSFAYNRRGEGDPAPVIYLADDPTISFYGGRYGAFEDSFLWFLIGLVFLVPGMGIMRHALTGKY